MTTPSQPQVNILIDTPETTTAGPNQGGAAAIITNRVKILLKPILTRFHAGYFRITLSLGCQTMLWKALTGPTDDTATLRQFLRHLFNPTAFLALWSVAFSALILLSLLYILKCIFYFNMVKAEFLHHVGVNYLFAPWISWLFLLQSAPFLSPKSIPYITLWWIFAVPVIALDVKIYGQWFTKGKNFLSTVANPTSQLTVVANFVGAHAAATMGMKEGAMCFFSLGFVHYLVIFVTLHQHLSSGDRIPAMLRPVFFLFIAVPSAASLAWESIAGTFDIASKMLFFLSLFIFASLVCRPMLFKGSMRRFNMAWWAYSYPLTVLALVSTEYAGEVKSVASHVLMVVLLCLSVGVALVLILFTFLNAKMLLPSNDPLASLLFCCNNQTRSIHPLNFFIE